MRRSRRGTTQERAHPRSRGENSLAWSGMPARTGSSPLTRGKCQVRQVVTRGRGLIPAHAGKIAGHAGRAETSRAHPRSRGENSAISRGSSTDVGSSPLTRGKSPFLAVGRFRVGLIPAHAGKIRRAVSAAMVSEAHPRSRGENRGQGHHERGPPGSSPLTRGKFRDLAGQQHGRGLIPAHAGKIMHATYPDAHYRAHPRSRGEN